MLKILNETFNINPLDSSYTLDIDKNRLATFSSISGGEIEMEVIKHNVVRESGEFQTLLIPGVTHFAPITLSNGYGNTKELYNWFVSASNGLTKAARKNVTISLNAHQKGKYEALVVWNLTNAMPIKIAGFEMDQTRPSNVARFSITLMAETIERVDP